MKKRVLLDCDGVLAAFVDGWLRLINDALDATYKTSDVTGWDVCASLGLPPEKHGAMKRLLAGCPEFAAHLEVLPGAVDGVRRLREIAEVYVVTSPWNSHPTWTHDREAWLRRRFDIPHSHVVHTSAKHLCVGDVLVDDKLEAVDRWRSAHPSGVAVLWSTPHNRRDLWDGPCTSDWSFLVELVRSLP